MALTDDQIAKLGALADQILVGVNSHDSTPYVQFNGRVGVQTNYKCTQPTTECAAFSVDSTDPTQVYIEQGATPAGGPLTAVQIFQSLPNPGKQMTALDITSQGGSPNVPLRLTGDGIEITKPGVFLIGRNTPNGWSVAQLFQS